MKAAFRIVSIIVLLAAIWCVSSAQGTGANAFLRHSVRTTDQLLAQVRVDSQIRDAYERHFQMSAPELYTFLKTLHPMALKEDEQFTIYILPPEREFKAHLEKLKKGELVFVDMNGKAILRARCGNPLARGSAGVIPDNATVSGEAGIKSVDLPKAEQMPVDFVALAPSPVAIPELVMVPQDEKQDEQEPQIISVERGISWWPLLGAPIVAGSFEGIGGGSSGGGGVGPPIPEPATMIIFGAGISGILLRRRKRAM